ncbi:MAG: hypothetical protein ACW99Q_17795, partial [Candidatus Kariarchaeaceae archaeon]
AEYLLPSQILVTFYYTYIFLGLLCIGYARYQGIRLNTITNTTTCEQCNNFEICICGCDFGLCKSSASKKVFTQTKTLSCEFIELIT